MPPKFSTDKKSCPERPPERDSVQEGSNGQCLNLDCAECCRSALGDGQAKTQRGFATISAATLLAATLICIFPFGITEGVKNLGLRGVTPSYASSAGDVKFVGVFNSANQKHRSGRVCHLNSRMEVGPLDIAHGPRRKDFLIRHGLSWLQSEISDRPRVTFLTVVFLHDVLNAGKHLKLTACDVCRSCPGIYNRELKLAFHRLPKFKVKFQGPDLAYYDPWPILQAESSIFNADRVFHLPELSLHGSPLPAHPNALSGRFSRLVPQELRLSAVNDYLPNKGEELQEPNNNQKPCKGLDFPLYLYVIIGAGCGILNFSGWTLVIGRGKWRLLGRLILGASSVGLLTDLGTFAFGSPVAFWRFRWLLGKDEHCEYQPFHGDKLYQPKKAN